MKKIYFQKILFLSLFGTLISCSNDTNYAPLPSAEARLYAGGETTVFLTSSNAYSTPAPNLSGSQLETHLEGDVQFEAIFVTAPAQINSGIGPIFNNTSCFSCHIRDGRASFPTDINDFSGFVLRVSIPGTTENNAPKPVPGFGNQIQTHSVFGYEAEAQLQISYQPITETFPDGTVVVLQKPTYSIINPYKPMPSGVLTSPRVAPPVFGLGLLEAISESEILQNQDLNDSDSDGISGKANYVYNFQTGEVEIGRFGWKANAPTLLQQCADAYNTDMGITSPYFPQETGFGQTNGEDGLGDDPEIQNKTLQDIVFYTRTLAVPAPRNIEDPEIIHGEKLFKQIDCAKCHIPKMITGTSDIPSLSNQIIFPYSDMLLHDMGNELGDNRSHYLATGNEWKTRPLWGIGLTEVVNGHTEFLHDGRAKSILEAILWHGGEALSSKNQFKALNQTDREDLLKFIKSL